MSRQIRRCRWWLPSWQTEIQEEEEKVEETYRHCHSDLIDFKSHWSNDNMAFFWWRTAYFGEAFFVLWSGQGTVGRVQTDFLNVRHFFYWCCLQQQSQSSFPADWLFWLQHFHPKTQVSFERSLISIEHHMMGIEPHSHSRLPVGRRQYLKCCVKERRVCYLKKPKTNPRWGVYQWWIKNNKIKSTTFICCLTLNLEISKFWHCIPKFRRKFDTQDSVNLLLLRSVSRFRSSGS